MAIPEACGLWIEQRVQEELENKGETGASLREIGRTVAAEVEKYFETKVNPGTILTKAARMAKVVSNETPSKNPTTTSVSGGDSGDKPNATAIVKSEIKKGKSVRAAAEVAADKTGLNSESIRKAHQRSEKKKSESKTCPICKSVYPGDYDCCPNKCERASVGPSKKSQPKIAHQKNNRESLVDPATIRTKEIEAAYGIFIREVADAMKSNWETTSREYVSQCLNNINFYLQKG